MQNVSIVIPNWNGRQLLPRYLPSVIEAARRYRDLYGAEVEVIVVDDGSTDGSLDWLREQYSDSDVARLIDRGINGGFATAVNTGFQAARHGVVLLLNNDLRADPDMLAPLVEHFKDPEVFAVCAKAYRTDGVALDGAGKLGYFQKGFWRVFLNYDILPTRLPEGQTDFPSFFASGGYAAYDARKFADMGGFQELLAPIYWEDVEICYRAWKRGYTVHYEPRSVVYHQSSATMGQQSLKKRVTVVSERNRLQMTWINLHDRGWLLSHVGWLGLKLIGAALSFDGVFLRAFWEALGRLPAIRRARAVERAASRRSDRELAEIFAGLRRAPWADVIWNEADYQRHLDLRRRLETGAKSEQNSPSAMPSS